MMSLMWCSARGLLNLGLFRLYYDKGPESWYSPEPRLKIYISPEPRLKMYMWLVPNKANQFWTSFLIRMKKDSFSKWMANYHILGFLLIWSSKRYYIWHSSSDRVYYLLYFTVLYCYPLVLSDFCRNKIPELIRNMMGTTTPAPFRSLKIVLV